MKNIAIILFFFIFLFYYGMAEWEEFNEGLSGASISKIEVNTKYIFILTSYSQTLFRLEKGKNSWERLHLNLDSNNIVDLSVNDSVVVATAQKGEVFISRNNGLNWKQVIINDSISSVLYPEIKNNEIFLMAPKYGIYSSSNYGVSWEDRTQKLSNKYIGNYCIKQDTLVVTARNMTGTDIFASTDNGETWSLKYTLDGVSHVLSILFYNNSFMIQPIEKGLMKSDDFLETWSRMDEDLPNKNIRLNNLHIKGDYLIATNAYTSTGIVVWSFTDNKWFISDSGLTDFSINCITSDSNTIYLGSYNVGVYQSTDNGTSWSTLTMEGVKTIVVNDLYVENEEIFIATNSQIANSNKYNSSWQIIPLNTGLLSTYTIFVKDGIYFAGQTSLFSSYDNGENWDKIYLGVVKSIVDYEGYLYVCSSGGYSLQKTSDYGANWEEINHKTFFNESVNSFAIKNDTMYVGTAEKGFYYSNDNGLIWTPISYAFDPPTRIYDILLKDNNIFVGSSSNGIFKSNDNCNTWNYFKTESKLDSVRIQTFKTFDNKIFAGTNDGVFLSNYNGTKWKDISLNLPKTTIKKIAFLGKYIYVATNGYGVFRRKLSDLGIVGIEVNHHSFSLNIFPNPVTTATTISFNLETDTQVSISISDIFGNEVAKLLNNEFYSSGSHSLQFNSAGLSSGVYFCTMRAGDRVETRKFVVVE